MMTYKIFKLVMPDHLQGLEQSGHNIRTTATRYILEIPEEFELTNDFDSIEEALKVLEVYGEEYQDYTIQPVIRIDN